LRKDGRFLSLPDLFSDAPQIGDNFRRLPRVSAPNLDDASVGSDQRGRQTVGNRAAFRLNENGEALDEIIAANKTPLAGWWTAHAGAWFAGIAVVWSAAMMTLASLRLNRWEE